MLHLCTVCLIRYECSKCLAKHPNNTHKCKNCGCRCPRYCRICRVSHKKVRLCDICATCRRICMCKKRPGSRDVSSKPLTRKEKLVNKLERTIGVEIELAKWGKFKAVPLKYGFYTMDHDGSVSSGEEAVFKPTSGDQFIFQMQEIAKVAKETGASVDQSCGFHVHIGARDLNIWDLRRLMRIYSVVERAIYAQLLTPERSTSRFCKRMSSSRKATWATLIHDNERTGIKNRVLSAIYNIPFTKEISAEALSRIRGGKYGGREGEPTREARYLGLNLHSYWYRNTVEFRMKEGTLDATELVMWPLFCLWMVELAAKMTDTQALSINTLGTLISHMPPTIINWYKDKLSQAKILEPSKELEEPDYTGTVAGPTVRTHQPTQFTAGTN